jgi:hypothetical protein
MRSQPLPIRQERVKIAQAIAITGKSERALQGMALAGKIPGAAKIGGEWTFNDATLRAWVEELEITQCHARPLPIRSGAARSYGVGSRSRVKSTGGHYEQTMLKLLAHGSKRTAGRP